ncbi:MAG: DUF3221 domain-containing protein [Culicoidibacterales bacterium]
MRSVKRSGILVAIVFLMSLGVWGVWQSQRQPDVQIRGIIQTLTKTETGVSALIQTPAGMEVADYDYAQVAITPTTSIWLEQESFELDRLEVGMQVEVSFKGAVLESYPVQASAKTVTIIQSDQLK